MQELIGRTAGKLWDTLKKKDEMSIAQLPKTLKEKDAVVFQALGWLAREGKVVYRTQGNRTFVKLSD
jgi:hypothetical protein